MSCEPDRDTDQRGPAEREQAITPEVLDHVIRCPAEKVACEGKGYGPEDGASEVENEEAQLRHVGRSDRERRDAAQPVVKPEAENKPVLMAAQVAINPLRLLLPGAAQGNNPGSPAPPQRVPELVAGDAPGERGSDDPGQLEVAEVRGRSG